MTNSTRLFFCCFFLFIAFFSTASAQIIQGDSIELRTKEVKREETIYNKEYNRWDTKTVSDYFYYIRNVKGDTTWIEIDGKGEAFNNYLSNCKPALKEVSQFQKHRKLARMFLITSGVTFLPSVVIGFLGSPIVFVAFVLPLTAGIIYSLKASKNGFHTIINTYNSRCVK